MSLKIATTPLLWPLLSTLLLTACFEITDDGGKPSQHNSDGGSVGNGGNGGDGGGDGGGGDGGGGDGGSLGDGGSTPDGGATDGGSPDGGATDGGGSDGGATDGGGPDGGSTDGGSTDGGTTAPPDTGIAEIYWNGSAEVVPDESYDGSEALYVQTYSAESLCSIRYPVSGAPTDTCASCDWAFDIDGTAGGTADGDIGCDWLLSLYGVTSASDLGLWSFSYGYASDYLGYETMFYDYYGYGWYAMDYAVGSYDGTTFDYSYFYAAFYFYWDDLH